MKVYREDFKWLRDRRRCGWELPPRASRWKRAPVFRAIRAVYSAWRVENHYSFYPGMARSGYDEWVIYAIRRGIA